jgi:hypothetical protein
MYPLIPGAQVPADRGQGLRNPSQSRAGSTLPPGGSVVAEGLAVCPVSGLRKMRARPNGDRRSREACPYVRGGGRRMLWRRLIAPRRHPRRRQGNPG